MSTDATPRSAADHLVTRVAVVDDHRMLLAALKEWIDHSAADLDVVVAVPSWPELLTNPAFPVDVVLLDLDLKDGIPVPLKIATLKQSGTECILISTYSEPAVVRQTLDAGALGYLVKSEPAERIVEAIRRARSGRTTVSDELLAALDDNGEGQAPKLSVQERRVMSYYASGASMREVASDLGIGEETAKSYLKRVREKYRLAGIDVSTKVALRKQALRDGIIIDSN